MSYHKYIQTNPRPPKFHHVLPALYRFHSEPDDWVPTFDPPIPMNGEILILTWPTQFHNDILCCMRSVEVILSCDYNKIHGAVPPCCSYFVFYAGTPQCYPKKSPEGVRSVVHYYNVIMGAIASKITSLTIATTVYSDADQRKHQSSAPLAFVRGLHRHRWIPRKNGQ